MMVGACNVVLNLRRRKMMGSALQMSVKAEVLLQSQGERKPNISRKREISD